MLSLGFRQSKADYSLFLRGSGTSFVALLLYVDDIIIIGPSLPLINELKLLLHHSFKLKDFGSLKYFLSLELARSSRGIALSQHHYTLSLLEDVGLLSCKPVSLPMDPNIHLQAATNAHILHDISLYRRLVGQLLYLTISRPDITFAVNKLSQYVSRPSKVHLSDVFHLLRYLKNFPGKEIFLSAFSNFQLRAFSDADWGSCLDYHWLLCILG